jgi:hypothetical protein
MAVSPDHLILLIWSRVQRICISLLIPALLLSGCARWTYYQEGKTGIDVQRDQSECENRIETIPEQGRKVKVLPTDMQITECMKAKGYQYIKAPRTQ